MANPLLALQVQSPDIVDSFNTGQATAQKLQANNLANLVEKQKFDQQQAAEARKNQLEQLYQQSAPALFGEDENARQGALAQIGAMDPEGALKLGTTIAAQRQTQFDNAKKKLDYFDNSLGSILDAPADKQEQIYQEKIAEAKRLGIPVNAPPNFDPAWVKTKHNEVLTAKDRLEQQDKQRTQDIQDRTERSREANQPFNPDGTPNIPYQKYEIQKSGEASRIRIEGQTAAGNNADPTIVQSHVQNVLSGNETMAQVPQALRNAVSVALTQQPTNSFSPLAAQRNSSAAARIREPYLKLPGYAMTTNGLPYLQRIDAAIKTPGSVSDQDLLDSLTKLNTAGNAVTDAQVKLITEGRSYSDWLNTIKNRFANGGVLSNSQRQQIQEIAKNIYENYKKGYKPVHDELVGKLKQSGIPEQFWGVPDFENISNQTLAPPQAAAAIPFAGATVARSAQGGNKTVRFEDLP